MAVEYGTPQFFVTSAMRTLAAARRPAGTSTVARTKRMSVSARTFPYGSWQPVRAVLLRVCEIQLVLAYILQPRKYNHPLWYLPWKMAGCLPLPSRCVHEYSAGG